MEDKPTVGVTREEFDSFCRQGRLSATKGNRDAGGLLKEHLERAGFAAFEAPISIRPRRILGAALLVALAIVGRDPDSFVAFLLLAGPMFRVWQGMRTGTPAAVYGVRKEPGSLVAAPSGTSADAKDAGGGTRATLVLCAHYDTTSVPFPFHGSFLRVGLAVIAVMIAAMLLSDAGHSIAAQVVGAAALGAYVFAVVAGNASPGADDNASGVFAVLACLRRLGHLNGVNIVPVFFNFEEQGLFGSRAWVEKHLGKKGEGIPGIEIDPKRAYAINFDCVGRGRRVFISGNRRLRERLLRTASARALNATRTWLYPSDHRAFRSLWSPWKAVSFARANRFWALDLGWIHSEKDVPAEIRLDNLVELSRIVEEFVQEEAGLSAERAEGKTAS